MAYTITSSLALGSSQTGLSLAAQLIDTEGTIVGSSVTTGFVEIGQGNYIWTYSDFPSGFRGAVKFYDQSDASEILAIIAINPEEIEYVNNVNNVIISPASQIEIKVPTPSGSNSVTVQSGTSGNSNINIQTGVR